jgi:hypothetical protein
MEKSPTAKEFIEMNSENHSLIDIEGIMIEFARFHVEAALKAASKKAKVVDVGIDYAIEEWAVEKSSILNSYPSKNIK